MATNTLKTRVQVRRDTDENWTSSDPTALAGEIMFSSDKNDFKVGDGESSWSSLSYHTAPLLNTTNGGTVTGKTTFNNAVESITALSGTSVTIPATGDIFSISLTAATTINIASGTSGELRTVTLLLTSNGYSVTWGSAVKWADDAPELTSGKVDIINFFVNGSSAYAVHCGAF